MSITIRPLMTIEECRRVAALERIVWGYSDSEDVVPPPVLIVSIKRGGILLGAFEPTGEMVGFVYSMPAAKDGVLTQWSHMLGVAPDWRGSGLGLRLKLAQREWAIRTGVALIEWTCDPLQALNAHLNIAKLGGVVEEYEEDIYGVSTSPLHAGTPTDRLVVEWHLTTPHVERRLFAGAEPRVRDAAVASAILVNPSRPRGALLEPGLSNLDADAERLLVEIPTGFTEMLAMQPDLALEWRLAVREILQTFIRRDYRIVDFLLARDAGRGQYVLARKSPSATP
jgi:predicted GNAT superfamily acetyltransferase